MTEQDAINALVGELEASEGQTEPQEVQGTESAEEQKTQQPQITQENLQNMIASAMQGIEEQKAAQEAEKPKRRSRQKQRSFRPSSKRC